MGEEQFSKMNEVRCFWVARETMNA